MSVVSSDGAQSGSGMPLPLPQGSGGLESIVPWKLWLHGLVPSWRVLVLKPLEVGVTNLIASSTTLLPITISKFLCQPRLCRRFGWNSVRYFRTQSFIVLVSTFEITLTTHIIAQDPNNVCKEYSFTLSHVCITLDKGVASRQHTAASEAYTRVHVAVNMSCEHCMCVDRSGCCTATNSQGVLLPVIWRTGEGETARHHWGLTPESHLATPLESLVLLCTKNKRQKRYSLLKSVQCSATHRQDGRTFPQQLRFKGYIRIIAKEWMQGGWCKMMQS